MDHQNSTPPVKRRSRLKGKKLRNSPVKKRYANKTKQILSRIVKSKTYTILTVISVICTISGISLVSLIPSFNNSHPSATSTGASTQASTYFPPLGTIIYTYRNHSDNSNPNNSLYTSTVVWALDGKRIASGWSDGTVQVWDATTGKNIVIYRGHKGIVNNLAWSPDGSRIASGADDGTVQVWTTDDGSFVYSYASSYYSMHKNSPVIAVAWSPDGQYIAFGTIDGYVQIFEALKGDIDNPPLLIIPPKVAGPILALVWSANSQQLAIAYGGHEENPFIQGDTIKPGEVDIWSFNSSNNPIATYRSTNPFILDMAWSPNGKYIAIASNISTINSILDVWDVSQENHPTHTTEIADDPGSLAWSCDSQQIAYGSLSYAGVNILDIKSQKTIFSFQAQGGSNSVAWSPNGLLIASAGSNVVKVWQASQTVKCSVHN